jgi:hypothetical protein
VNGYSRPQIDSEPKIAAILALAERSESPLNVPTVIVTNRHCNDERSPLTGCTKTRLSSPSFCSVTRSSSRATAGTAIGSTKFRVTPWQSARPAQCRPAPLSLRRLSLRAKVLGRCRQGVDWTLKQTRRLARAVLPAPLLSWLGGNFGNRHSVRRVRLGNLRRLTPVSAHFGWDRGGLPVDRYYIEPISPAPSISRAMSSTASC